MVNVPHPQPRSSTDLPRMDPNLDDATWSILAPRWADVWYCSNWIFGWTNVSTCCKSDSKAFSFIPHWFTDTDDSDEKIEEESDGRGIGWRRNRMEKEDFPTIWIWRNWNTWAWVQLWMQVWPLDGAGCRVQLLPPSYENLELLFYQILDDTSFTHTTL